MDENGRLNLEWNLQRTLAKINYRIHTDAIKENLIPKLLTGYDASLFCSRQLTTYRKPAYGGPIENGTQIPGLKVLTQVEHPCHSQHA